MPELGSKISLTAPQTGGGHTQCSGRTVLDTLGATAEHLAPSDLIIRAQAQEGSKVGFAVEPAHVDTYLGNDGLRVHDIDAIDLGEIGSADPVELAAQVKRSGGIIARSLIGFGPRQMARRFDFVLETLQMGLQGGVTFGDLLLIDLIQIQFLLQNEQQLLAPVTFQTAGDFLPCRLNPNIG